MPDKDKKQEEYEKKLSDNPMEFMMDFFVDIAKAFAEGVKRGMGMANGVDMEEDPMKQMQSMMKSMMQMFQSMQSMQMQNQMQALKQMSDPKMASTQMPNLHISAENDPQKLVTDFVTQTTQNMMTTMMQYMQMQVQNQNQMQNQQPQMQNQKQPEKVKTESELVDEVIKSQEELKEANEAYKKAKAENDALVEEGEKIVEAYDKAIDYIEQYKEAIDKIEKEKDPDLELDEKNLERELEKNGGDSKLAFEKNTIARAMYKLEAQAKNNGNMNWFSNQELDHALSSIANMDNAEGKLSPAAGDFRSAIMGLKEEVLAGKDPFMKKANLDLYKAAGEYIKEVNASGKHSEEIDAALQAANNIRQRLEENGRIDKLKTIESYENMLSMQQGIGKRRAAQDKRDQKKKELENKLDKAKQDIDNMSPEKVRENKKKLDESEKKLEEARKRRKEAMNRTRKAQNSLSRSNNQMKKSKGHGM